MKRRLLAIVALLLVVLTPAVAVLKEKSLAETLGVLLAELQSDYDKQQYMKQHYESQSAQQHEALVENMQRCEQIGLMLYSQKADYTFDMAAACQEATKLHKELQSANRLPYEKIRVAIEHEIERYDALIVSLKKLPPIEKADKEAVMTQADTIIQQAMDSLQMAADSVKAKGADTLPVIPVLAPKTEEKPAHTDPYMLTPLQQQQRAECLRLAQAIRDNLKGFLDKLTNDNLYYTSVQTKSEELYRFAQTRYGILQQNIFKNGGSNFFHILGALPTYVALAIGDCASKYLSFHDAEAAHSQWRGMSVLYISIFAILYLALALVLTYVTLRWLLPKSWRSADFKYKRQMLNNVVGIALFAVLVLVARRFGQQNALVEMGTGLMVSMAWILEAIFLSLYIRLKGEQMRHAAMIYSPIIFISIVIILFRIVLIPDSAANLLLPPIMLVATIWQVRALGKHRRGLPQTDMIFAYITTLMMAAVTVTTWAGYTLMAVEMMLWWIFQLSAIQTIVCVYDMMEMFENRFLAPRLNPAIRQAMREGKDVTGEVEHLIERMKQGYMVSRTWLYDFVNRAAVPILGVLSVLLSVVWTANIFEMVEMCRKIFLTNFIDEKNVVQLSLFKIVVVVCGFFVFRYINYMARSIYRNVRKATLDEGEQFNATLARNVIAILVWGAYLVFCLVFLHVPSQGISVITAGLATGMGFAMKDLLENFFYGLSLMTGRVHVGDYIECDGIRGKVESITYQSTQIVTIDGSVIAFLNSALFSKNFKNLTRNHRYELTKIPVGVAYGTNVEEVRQLILKDIIPLCGQTGSTGMPLTNPDSRPAVVFNNFGDSSVDLLLCVWVLVEDCASFKARAREIIYNTLTRNNIEIPFPQCDLNVRSLPGKPQM